MLETLCDNCKSAGQSLSATWQPHAGRRDLQRTVDDKDGVLATYLLKQVTVMDLVQQVVPRLDG